MSELRVDTLALYVLAWHIAVYPDAAQAIAAELERLIATLSDSPCVPEYALALKTLREKMSIVTAGEG